MGQRALNLLHWTWLALMLLAGVLLRTCHLSYPALTIDEAESCINAMTILNQGYPGDTYLGLPIFENTLVLPWPDGHEEYEFKDLSYSDRGMAIYHGWLPLYAIAGSYLMAGVEPDVATDPPHVQTGPEDIWLRTVAARMPAVIFGILTLAIAYLTGRTMAGRDAGSLAATIVALAPPVVRIVRGARYYAAAHALGLLCCLAVWLMASRGRWRDYVLGAAGFSLLFHTHAVTFALATLIWLGTLPIAVRRPKSIVKICTFVAALAVAVVPWAITTGFPAESSRMVPAARQLLAFPEDYFGYFLRHWKLTALLAVGAAALAGAYLLRRRLPQRVTEPLVAPAGAILLLVAWLVVGYFAFLLIVPAPSAFLWRSTLAVQVQGIVLVAILLAAGARMLHPRFAAAAPLAIGITMLALPAVRKPLETPPQWNQPVYAAIDYLRQQEFAPGTRIYASPLSHLTLTLLTGMPIQSTAPVRKRFFDNQDGELVILETAYRGQELSPQDVHSAASAAGMSLSDGEARDWAWRLSTRRLREHLIERGAYPEPPIERLPEFLEGLAEELRRRPPIRESADGRWDNPAMFRGYETDDKWGFWQVFFYRFVDPVSRSGNNLNYAGRVERARAVVLESTWVVFHASRRPPLEAPRIPPGLPGASAPREPGTKPAEPQRRAASDAPLPDSVSCAKADARVVRQLHRCGCARAARR